jgi:hypothetical protein
MSMRLAPAARVQDFTHEAEKYSMDTAAKPRRQYMPIEKGVLPKYMWTTNPAFLCAGA